MRTVAVASTTLRHDVTHKGKAALLISPIHVPEIGPCTMPHGIPHQVDLPREGGEGGRERREGGRGGEGGREGGSERASEPNAGTSFAPIASGSRTQPSQGPSGLPRHALLHSSSTS